MTSKTRLSRPRCNCHLVFNRLSHLNPLRRHLITLPIKELPPILKLPSTNNLHQLLRRELRTKQLLLFHIPPELLAEVRLDRTRVQTDSHSVLSRARLQMVVESLRGLVDSCF